MDPREAEYAEELLELIGSFTESLMNAKQKQRQPISIREAHRRVHTFLFPEAVSKLMQEREAGGEPITAEQAHEILHGALMSTDTEAGRGWWHRWCARIYGAGTSDENHGD